MLLPPPCCVRHHQAKEDAADTSEGSKKRWYEEKKKRQEEQLAKLGLTPEEAHRLESAEVAEAKYKKKVRPDGKGCIVVYCQQGFLVAASNLPHPSRVSQVKPVWVQVRGRAGKGASKCMPSMVPVASQFHAVGRLSLPLATSTLWPYAYFATSPVYTACAVEQGLMLGVMRCCRAPLMYTGEEARCLWLGCIQPAGHLERSREAFFQDTAGLGRIHVSSTLQPIRLTCVAQSAACAGPAHVPHMLQALLLVVPDSLCGMHSVCVWLTCKYEVAICLWFGVAVACVQCCQGCTA